jgi:hypothetical protein
MGNVNWTMTGDSSGVVSEFKKIDQTLAATATSGGRSIKQIDMSFEKAQHQLRELNAQMRNLQLHMNDAGGGTDAQRQKMAALSSEAEKLQLRIGGVGQAHSSLGNSAKTELAGMVAGWASVAVAVTAFRSGLALVEADMKRIHEVQEKTTQTLVQTMAKSGDLAQGPKIRAALMGPGMSDTATTMQERIATYGAVRSAAPMMDLDRSLAITKELLNAKKGGMIPEALGVVAGEIAKIEPGAKPEEVANMAAFLNVGAGRHGRALTRERGGGLGALGEYVGMGLGTTEQGMGMMLASMNANKGVVPFEAMVEKLSEKKEIAPAPVGKALAGGGKAEDPAKALERRYFAEDSPQKRLQMLETDPAMRKAVMGSAESGFVAMMGQDPGRFARAAAAARTGSFIDREGIAAMANPEWSAQMQIAQVESATEIKEAGKKDVQENIKMNLLKQRQAGVNPAARGISSFVMQTGAALGLDVTNTDLSMPGSQQTYEEERALDLMIRPPASSIAQPVGFQGVLPGVGEQGLGPKLDKIIVQLGDRKPIDVNLVGIPGFMMVPHPDVHNEGGR